MIPAWQLPTSLAFVFALALSFAGEANAAETLRRLGAKEIRAKIAGQVLTDQVHWSRTFQRNGTLASIDMGEERTGRWEIQGNRLCFASRKAEPLECYEVLAAGNEIHLRRDGAPDDFVGIVQKPGSR